MVGTGNDEKEEEEGRDEEEDGREEEDDGREDDDDEEEDIFNAAKMFSNGKKYPHRHITSSGCSMR